MLANYAYNYRLEPKGEAPSILAQAVGNQRFAWNWALARQKNEYGKTKKKLTYGKLASELAVMKEANPFLKDGFSQCQQQTLRHLEKAYVKFFKGAGFPRFKKKGRCRESLSLTNQQVKLDRDNGRIKFPKIGWVSFRKDKRKIVGKVINATVSKKNGKWDVSIVVEQEIEVRPKRGSAIGIDLGVSRFVSFSDGTFVKPLNPERKSSIKLAKLQAKAARKTRHSSNQKKAYAKASRLMTKTANERKDFLHKLTDTICKSHAVVIVEDLGTSRMSRSAKGTKENPGRNVSAKRGLNRSIRDQSWGNFLAQLEYKSKRRGVTVVRVNPAFTSQKCSDCGHISKENRQTQSKFLCVSCGISMNADHNAAKNILAGGLSALTSGQEGMACGSNPHEEDRKQETHGTSFKSRRNPRL